jgi:hypothetical protein
MVRPTRSVATVLAVAALGVPPAASALPTEDLRFPEVAGVPAIPSDLRSPDASGAPEIGSLEQQTPPPSDLRSPDASGAPEIGSPQQQTPPPSDLRSPDAVDSARMLQSPEPPVAAVEPPSFDWGDAGIGAGAILGLILVGLAVAFAVVHGRNRTIAT